MQKPRMNPYLLPHKGLRYLLSKVSLLAGTVNTKNFHSIEELKIYSNELYYLLEQHGIVEDEIILPLLEEKIPGSTQENHEEHEMLEAIVAKLHRQVNALDFESTEQYLLDYFFYLSDFHSKYLAHMLLEERQILNLIWDQFTDEDLSTLHHQIISSFTPEKLIRWFRFIVPALNPQERQLTLSNMKGAPFFEDLVEAIREEMPAFQFHESENEKA